MPELIASSAVSTTTAPFLLLRGYTYSLPDGTFVRRWKTTRVPVPSLNREHFLTAMAFVARSLSLGTGQKIEWHYLVDSSENCFGDWGFFAGEQVSPSLDPTPTPARDSVLVSVPTPVTPFQHYVP